MPKFFLDESKIETYRDEYAKTHCVFLPGFLEKNTLQTLLDKLDRGGFYPKEEGKEDYKFGKILALPKESSPVFIFTMLMSDQNLFNINNQVLRWPVFIIHDPDVTGVFNLCWSGFIIHDQIIRGFVIPVKHGDNRFEASLFYPPKRGKTRMLMQYLDMAETRFRQQCQLVIQ